MVQLLKHLSCCYIMVQPGHDSATILNAAAGYARCITLVMQGGKHVEPVILYGTVQVRTLEEVVEQLHPDLGTVSQKQSRSQTTTTSICQPEADQTMLQSWHAVNQWLYQGQQLSRRTPCLRRGLQSIITMAT